MHADAAAGVRHPTVATRGASGSGPLPMALTRAARAVHLNAGSRCCSLPTEAAVCFAHTPGASDAAERPSPDATLSTPRYARPSGIFPIVGIMDSASACMKLKARLAGRWNSSRQATRPQACPGRGRHA